MWLWPRRMATRSRMDIATSQRWINAEWITGTGYLKSCDHNISVVNDWTLADAARRSTRLCRSTVTIGTTSGNRIDTRRVMKPAVTG